MYSTFIHLHHVKDWFKDKVILKEARAYADSDINLQRCEMIANLWKHARPDRGATVRPGRGPTHIQLVASNIPALAAIPQKTRFPFLFEDKNGAVEEIEAVDLAERCLVAWDKFIAQLEKDGRLK